MEKEEKRADQENDTEEQSTEEIGRASCRERV